MLKPSCLLPFVICFGLTGFAQTKDEVRPIGPGQVVEREIAGGQTHAYQITLATGQFMRVVAEQKAVDVALALVGPDGEPATEVNLTRAGGQETLSHVATQNGRHQLVARAVTPPAATGPYQIRLEVRETATDQDRRRIAAERLLIEASKLRGEAAIDKLQPALTQWRELGDRRWEVFTLNSLGDAYRLLSRFQESIERAEQALAISRQIEDRYSEAHALSSLGIANATMGRLEQAAGYFERALIVRREAKLRAGEAASLSNLGTINNLLNRNDRAIEYLEQALGISRELRDRRSEGVALHNLGENYLKTTGLGKAAENFEAALAIHRELKDKFSEGTTLGSLGTVYQNLGRPDRAVECLEQSLQIKRDLRDRNGQGITLNGLGVILRDMGRPEKGSEYFEQALQIGREVKNPLLEASALSNLGNGAFALGRPERAIEHHELSLRIKRNLKDLYGEAVSLNNLGNAFSFLGRYERALEYYGRALVIYRELKNRASEGIALGNMSIVYQYLGLVDKAIGCVEEALAIGREVKDRDKEGIALYTLGEIYQTRGRSGPAMERFEQALAIFREVKNRAHEGKALGNLGYVHLSLGRHENATRYFEQALAINREVTDRPSEGHMLAGLGRAYQALGQSEKAVSHFQQALAVHREVKDRAIEVQTLHSYAKAELEQGNLDRARSLIEECLRITESLRADIYNTERRASYFASAQGAYEFYIDLLMRLERSNPSRGYDALALAASERARARGLVEMLTEAGAEIRQGVDSALIERERALAWQINAKARRLASCNASERATLNREISQLEDEYQQAQAAIRRASAHYAALTQPQPLTLAEIQQLLDDGTLLLEYSLGGERSYLWAVTNNSLASYELPKREQIELEARRVYDLLNARSRSLKGETPSRRRARLTRTEAQLPEATGGLSQTLLAPVAAKLGAKRLVIVADGALQYLPFAMLHEPERERRGDRETRRQGDKRTGGIHNPQSATRNPQSPAPLIVKHEVVSLPSASALAALRQELVGRKPAPNNIAVIGDPVFAAGDERVKTIGMGGSSQKDENKGAPQTDAPVASAENTRIIEHLAEDSGKSTAGQLVIPRLPFTRQEADQILALASGAPGSINLQALDFKANRATATSAELSKYRYLHFATHGILDSERPGLSALALSLVDEQGKPQDGFLRAHEIYNLNLPAELVVLSACQTGLGKEIKGEGLVGLTRGFMYAGAARVVVSLWSVNDRATAELMAKFYRKMLKENQRPAAALRSAQVEMWRSSQWQSPYFWAAFVLQGEWK